MLPPNLPIGHAEFGGANPSVPVLSHGVKCVKLGGMVIGFRFRYVTHPPITAMDIMEYSAEYPAGSSIDLQSYEACSQICLGV